MGHLSPLDGVGPAEIGIDALETLLGEGEVREVILATNPTVEGEATAHFLAEVATRRGVRARASRTACRWAVSSSSSMAALSRTRWRGGRRFPSVAYRWLRFLGVQRQSAVGGAESGCRPGSRRINAPPDDTRIPRLNARA